VIKTCQTNQTTKTTMLIGLTRYARLLSTSTDNKSSHRYYGVVK